MFKKEKFRELRKKHRWTTKALSEASNISRESISKWENGQREPSERSIYKLAKTIGVRVSEISDLEDLYPKAEVKISDAMISDNTNLLEAISNEEDSYLNNILANLNNMNNNLKRVSGVLKTILLNVNNIIYIKDTDQKYVLVSKAFLDNCSLKINFVSKGKVDEDFFPRKEAVYNTKEDEQIFSTGIPVINAERHIPGSRKQKWGIFNKIPIMDSSKKIKGLICVIVDITGRKKEEKYSQILEYAISQSKTTIWVGQGVDLGDNPYICKDIIYWRKSESKEFWGNTTFENFSEKELREKWFESISLHTKIKFAEDKKNFNYPKTKHYYVTSPFTGNRIWIRERIFFDKENETFVGLITEDTASEKLHLLSNIIGSMSNIIVWSGYFDSDNEFNFSYLNDTEKVTGYSCDDFLLNKTSFSSLAVVDHKELFEYFNAEASFPISFEFKIIKKDNKECWLKGNFFKEKKFAESDTDVYFGYYVDISESKYLEESLRDMKFKELGIDLE